MGTPYLGEIRLMSFNFAPKGWALCNGQFLPINQNQPLFALLGTNYGGNGQTTFALPNLQGRVPVGFGSDYTLGEQFGEYAHTLTAQEMPAHVHTASVAASANTVAPSGTVSLAQPGKAAYAPTGSVAMNPLTVSTVGGSQPHENTAPYLTVQFAIALVGIFPSQN
jgi:microcystin-dependent protein